MAHILIDSQLIRPTLFTKSWKDLEYNSLMGILYSEGFLKEKVDRGFYLDERGKNSNCTWEELFFFQTLVDYFILMKDAFFKIECPEQTDIDSLKEDYQLDCIRKTVMCKFGNTALYDKLLQKLNISIEGISNMVEGLYFPSGCLKPFIIHPNP
jgi:hypothetical protein